MLGKERKMEWNSSLVEDKIGIQFKNNQTLYLALSHLSYAQQLDVPQNSNERLTFLGEAILNLVIVDYLYCNCHYLEAEKLVGLRDKLKEGEMLTKLWFQLGLGENYPFMVLKEERHRLRLQSRNPFEQSLKALVGAIYLDRGFSLVRNWLTKNLLSPVLERHLKKGKERSLNEQQLQFLGEALLKAIVTDYLYNHLPCVSPNQLITLSKPLMNKERQAEYLIHLTTEDWTKLELENEQIARKSFKALLASLYLRFSHDKTKNDFSKTSGWFTKEFVDDEEVLRHAIALLLKNGQTQKWIISKVMGYESKNYQQGKERFHALIDV